MSPLGFDPVNAVLAIPAAAAVLLTLLPGYRLSARVNVIAAMSVSRLASTLSSAVNR